MTLECASVSVHFDGIAAVNQFSMRVEPRSITALIGPNGAGKTTLLNAITGLLRPRSGKVLLDGCDITGEAAYRVCRLGLARTFQDLRLARRLSLLENVLLACPNQPRESSLRALWTSEGRRDRQRTDRALELLEAVELGNLASEPASALSYGQQKLLTIACCLATDAAVLMLDEPVAGVDPHIRKKLLGLLSKLPGHGRTVVFIEHDLDAVRELADSIVVMDEGRKIAEGAWAVITSDAAVKEAYLA